MRKNIFEVSTTDDEWATPDLADPVKMKWFKDEMNKHVLRHVGMVKVRLSGEPLALVLERIGGIPKPQEVKMLQFTWFGDDARTILWFLTLHYLEA